MSNQDYSTKIAEATLRIINEQLQKYSSGMARNRDLGLELVAVGGKVSIDSYLPIGAVNAPGATIDDAIQAIRGLEKTSRQFTEAFSVSYEGDVIRIIKKEDVEPVEEIILS